MQYIALLLLIANVAFFGYHYMFAPQARFNPAANTPAVEQSQTPGQSALRLVTEVEPSDLEPRSGN